ncbi:small leucine-rich protein 1-like isoform X2 [Rhinichthys klamathensis goyatoka]|uniref:small leucine-rich protein 1-like isoform X2 n=1 Tax=Rhinichthys klamathensis goyatoka TaxID=3034132 RepID=UPI0024B51801|nr:small leucine-rich protein 1-like isoform X2 [Rhinichthys klamathensis goyatoka]
MSSPAAFLDRVPGWFLWTGIFLPVSALLLLVIAHLSWRIRQKEELAMTTDPRDTASQLSYRPRHRRRTETRSRT